MSSINSIQSSLYGQNPFYNQADYAVSMENEFLQVKPPQEQEPSYTVVNPSRFKCLKVLSWVIFPIGISIGLCKCIHALAGKFVLSSSGRSNSAADRQMIVTNLQARGTEGWKFKRLTIVVDGCRIDATIMGKASTLQNRRWVLATNGRGGLYEDKFDERGLGFRALLDKVQGNALIFNYSGVGGSAGYFPQRKAMAKAYSAMLTFLEDQEKGIGAKKIIGYGYSIGGGIQGEGLRKHTLKPWSEIKYVFVKNKSFSNFCAAASLIKSPAPPPNSCCLRKCLVRLLDWKPFRGLRRLTVKLLGWNLSSRKSSKMMQVPEIIRHSSKDEIIGDNASLARELLGDKNCSKRLKVFIPTKENHTPELGVEERRPDAAEKRNAAVSELVDFINSALNSNPLKANSARA